MTTAPIARSLRKHSLESVTRCRVSSMTEMREIMGGRLCKRLMTTWASRLIHLWFHHLLQPSNHLMMHTHKLLHNRLTQTGTIKVKRQNKLANHITTLKLTHTLPLTQTWTSTQLKRRTRWQSLETQTNLTNGVSRMPLILSKCYFLCSTSF